MARSAKKGRPSKKAKRPTKGAPPPQGKQTQVYEHTEEKLLLRPDVGLQPEFKQKRPPRTYRYDRSLDPALSWDINADRERGEVLIGRIESAANLAEAKAAAGQLRRMSKPFLNWAGKAERAEMTVPTLPLFVHERLSTQAILESFKSHKRDRQQTLALFADEEMDVTDRLLRAYQHQTNWVNRLILGDSLVVMNSLLQYEGLGGQVQMVYIDPPYGVRFGSNFQPFVRRRDVKHGDDTDMSREPEMVQAYRDTWELGLHSYLTYLRDRFLICRELLHSSGSIFVQISDENLHHVRELMDEVFGQENLAGLIMVRKTSAVSSPTAKTNTLPPTCDFLVWYAKDIQSLRYRQLYIGKDAGDAGGGTYAFAEAPDGSRRRMTAQEMENPSLVPVGHRIFLLDNLTSTGWSAGLSAPVTFEGVDFSLPSNLHWKTTPQGMQTLIRNRRVARSGRSLRYVRYFDDFPVSSLSNVWLDTGTGSFTEPKTYVVQTNTKVLERCILMTTDPGDLVLDPTCGSGTTAYASEQWGRRWITIDTSRVPLALARQRLLTATFPYYELRDSSRGPARGFVYRRRQNQKHEEVGGIVPHITLRSIAQDLPPQEEVLVDRPDVEPEVVRVSGPFVVEATIPTAIEVESNGAVREPEPTTETDPIGRMIEILRRAASLRLAGNLTVLFRNVRRPAKTLELHAEAEMVEPSVGERQQTSELPAGKPVAFVFGPENGPVTERLVFAAAREAHLKSYAHLFVVGFAIQPGASKLIQSCEQAVGLPATYVQATMDLLMSDLLKTTRASQVFAVTGAPDVRLYRLARKENPSLFRVEFLGLDTFDPVSMQVKHQKGEEVPAWFLDTEYDERVFHIHQAFFPRTGAWENLRRALRGTFEDSVWESLAGTRSEPFAGGQTGQIAVKVIDERGNELMVVRPLVEADPEP